jgi:ABC-type branched-subunit amino acid transport system ATPase component
MINLDGIVAGYQQGSRILDNLTLCVRRGEIAALMGRNGMGKTTLLRVLTGHLPISKGSIEIAGTSILGLPPYEIANLGPTGARDLSKPHNRRKSSPWSDREAKLANKGA